MIGDEDWLPPLLWCGGEMTIRIYSVLDSNSLREATNESYEHLKPWMPWAVKDQTNVQAERTCRRLMSAYLGESDFSVGIWSGAILVGGTGFHLRGRPLDSKTGEIGMWIRASHANQGWGTRVLEQMIEWGFTEWGWERLFWQCDTRNTGSRRVAEKAGMTLEGTFRADMIDTEGNRCDSHRFAILKSEWQKR